MGLVGVFPQHCNAPLIVKMGVMTQEEADQKYQQMLVEMMQDDFNALWYYLMACTILRPGGGSQRRDIMTLLRALLSY